MNITRDAQGKTRVQLTKAETRRLVEAKYIASTIHGAMGSGSAEQTMHQLQWLVSHYGAKHLDERGNVVESPRTLAINESAPTEPPAPNPPAPPTAA